jgi:hypothetical protein
MKGREGSREYWRPRKEEGFMELKKYMQYGQTVLVLAIAVALTACGGNKTTSSGSAIQNNPYDPYNLGLYQNTNDAGYLADNFQYRNLTVNGANSYKNFMKKALGVCDRAANSGGIYSCDTWLNSYFRLIVQAQSTVATQMRAIFMVYPQQSQYGWYGYQLPSWDQFFMGIMGFPVPTQVGAVRNPLAIDMTVSLINNSQGFEGRAYGAYDTLANKSLIQMQAATGKVLDNTLAVTLSFEGQQFASGTLYRCTYPNCQ